MAGKYADLTRDELVKLLEARDRRKKLRLVWEREEIAADRRRNADFVVCELDKGLSDLTAPWENIVIEADNFYALRWLRMTHLGAGNCANNSSRNN